MEKIDFARLNPTDRELLALASDLGRNRFAARAAQIVLWSTVALAITALLPVFFGAGIVYFLGAATGGGYFVHKARQLAQAPARKTAMGAFFASLIQLSLLLGGATLDSLLR